MNARRLTATVLCSAAAAAALSGCAKKGDIVVDSGVGITAVRTACPAVGIPDYTGDITLFRVPNDKTAANIDVVAAMTNVRSQCSDQNGAQANDKVSAQVSFDVLARRTDTQSARQITLPIFVSVLQGGSAVVSKRVGQVQVNFAAGQDRAQAHGVGTAYIDRASATLPADIRQRITRPRKAGGEDAAVDPLSQPDVKTAVARASFEVLVGFQLDESQLAYNATR
ncbi:hypothetical protein EDF56_10349 [Novosphingobium sp. PhB165]|uniref:hypothetical protein n=1 Tax=Novosphingobium sp. PhB165 TaxID=2485105 RepID=UPI00104A981D|nr:hypothetical protein [Novosphingobium sp. PhB165]TCM19414.1 hypothetical protein EDF56_10349 [Novosphingobium sp. PhB165]